MEQYLSANTYFKRIFNEKVYRIAIDAGFSCPNRDGKLGTRGCIFCSAGGSGEFAGSRNDSITSQIENGKALVEKKLKQGVEHKYIAYFQAFTNTYAPISVLKEKYLEAINHKDIVALSIATRPDCIDDEVIALLTDINKIKPVFVELGLQTIHAKTAAYIRRGYPLSVYDSALKKLRAANLDVITHVILGLPGETREMMLETVKYVCNSGAKGIKLQLLHVLKGTDLAKDYEEGKFEVLTLDEYVSLIEECIRIIPKDIVIHRLTGDGDKKLLIAPLWSADKKKVLNTLKQKVEAI